MRDRSKITEEELREAGRLGAGLTKKEKYVLRFYSGLPLSDRAREIVERMSHSLRRRLFYSGFDKIEEAKARAVR